MPRNPCPTLLALKEPLKPNRCALERCRLSPHGAVTTNLNSAAASSGHLSLDIRCHLSLAVFSGRRHHFGAGLSVVHMAERAASLNDPYTPMGFFLLVVSSLALSSASPSRDAAPNTQPHGGKCFQAPRKFTNIFLAFLRQE